MPITLDKVCKNKEWAFEIVSNLYQSLERSIDGYDYINEWKSSYMTLVKTTPVIYLITSDKAIGIKKRVLDRNWDALKLVILPEFGKSNGYMYNISIR